MSKRMKLWLVPALVYALFVYWYTDFGGPLSEEEIAVFSEQLRAARDVDEAALQRIQRFMREDTGRQFFMVNIIDYADNPPEVEGAEPGEDARQLMNRYMAYMFPQLLRRACHPAIMGNAINDSMDLVGIDNAEHWDMGALMRYRSRRALMEIVANADQKDSHVFKIAALDKTIAFPVESPFNPGDPRLLLGLLLLAVTALLDARQARRSGAGD